MKKTGASLAVYALEQIGARFTFGVPGVHNTELYDELGKSKQIQPVLVTHELCGAFMADAISRTSATIGVLAIVPAAGATHAMSGIGEAFLDGIPMLVLSGGIRRDSGRHYQLHEIDQTKLLAAVTKKATVVRRHEDIVPTIFEAYELAVSGTPGPVFVELPVELQMFRAEVGSIPSFQPRSTTPELDPDSIREAGRLLGSARRPGIYAGWGARDCGKSLIELAELLEAPVATTMQGLSVFPANHPLHAGMGFGVIGTPAAEKAFSGCDCLFAVGARFSELATGSYSLPVPANLIHSDINGEVFDRNFPAAVTLQGDASEVVAALVQALKADGQSPPGGDRLRDLIRNEKEAYLAEWLNAKPDPNRVNPARFFTALRRKLDDDAFVCVDDGNHTFLAAELFPVYHPKGFVSPTDFNAMGYCVPATIGAKLANPDHQVVGIVGDGAFLMTGLEVVTAAALNLGVVFFVFHDGELGQIAQFQQIPLNRKTCTVLGSFKVEGVARAAGAAFVPLRNDDDIEKGLEEAFSLARDSRPVLVDVRIDYSRKTRFTQGVVKTNLSRFSTRDKLRFVGRALKRHVLG